MLACSSPWLFAAGHVLLRRMVPWHPPCALISVIFSSLFSLRPIESSFRLLLIYVITFRFVRFRSLAHALPLPFNWPFLESFFVQLSRCIPRTLKTIQTSFSANQKQFLLTRFASRSGSFAFTSDPPSLLPVFCSHSHASLF